MIPHWLLDESDLSLHEFVVYVALLRFRDPVKGTCYPGFNAIAQRARVSRSTVVRTIPMLESRGIIHVTRQKVGTTNVSNVYKVAVPVDSKTFAKKHGRKAGGWSPERRPSFSEELPEHKEAGDNADGWSSQTPPSVSEKPGVVSERNSKKTHPKNTHQEDVTPNFASEVGRDLSSDWAIPSSELFTDETHESRATAAQISYLTDLVLHLHHEQPSEENLSRWRRLTPEQADQAIRGYKKALGRPDEILYPEHGSEAFGLLSPAGQAFAETAGMPGSVS